MLPVYLVRQDESWDKGFWHSLALLQRVATLIQWSHLLQEYGAKDWLTQEHCGLEIPCDSMERAFQLSLATHLIRIGIRFPRACPPQSRNSLSL